MGCAGVDLAKGRSYSVQAYILRRVGQEWCFGARFRSRWVGLVVLVEVTSNITHTASEILRKAHDAVERCPCAEGCAYCTSSPFLMLMRTQISNTTPSGIHSAKCREENKVSSKLGALLVLRGLLNLEINPESIPERVDEETGFDTIVEADYVRAVDGVEVER